MVLERERISERAFFWRAIRARDIDKIRDSIGHYIANMSPFFSDKDSSAYELQLALRIIRKNLILSEIDNEIKEEIRQTLQRMIDILCIVNKAQKPTQAFWDMYEDLCELDEILKRSK